MGLATLISKLLSDEAVEEKYLKAGPQFGAAVSYIYMGECVGFKQMLGRWQRWEDAYASRGYRTLSLDAFVKHGGYGESIEPLLGQKRKDNEEPVYHAGIYRDNFLGKIQPVIDVGKMMSDGKIQVATYTTPSTEPEE